MNADERRFVGQRFAWLCFCMSALLYLLFVWYLWNNDAGHRGTDWRAVGLVIFIFFAAASIFFKFLTERWIPVVFIFCISLCGSVLSLLIEPLDIMHTYGDWVSVSLPHRRINFAHNIFLAWTLAPPAVIASICVHLWSKTRTGEIPSA